MSFGAIGDTTLPPVAAANEPADIRNGNAAAKNAYQEALGFEDILVQQLTQELASSGGMLGSDQSSSAFASLIPTALTQSIMSSGGLGIAGQIAQAIDPGIGTPQGEASGNKTVGAQ